MFMAVFPRNCWRYYLCTWLHQDLTQHYDLPLFTVTSAGDMGSGRPTQCSFCLHNYVKYVIRLMYSGG